jgi:hypothetical protein
MSTHECEAWNLLMIVKMIMMMMIEWVLFDLCTSRRDQRRSYIRLWQICIWQMDKWVFSEQTVSGLKF